MSTTGQTAVVLTASWDPSILWYGLYLAGALLVGAVVVELVRRYIRTDRSERLTPSDQLAQYRSLYEQGTLSEEEFNSLRALLGGELRASARKPGLAAGAGPDKALPQQHSGPSTGVRSPDSEPPPTPPETGIKPA
jgi:hypothetical protein